MDKFDSPVRAKIDKALWVLLVVGAAWVCYKLLTTPGMVWLFR